MAETRELEPVTTTTTPHEVGQAWRNWLHYHRGIDCDEVMERFFLYLHSIEQSHTEDCLDWDASDPDTIYKVSPGTAERVRMGASPDFNAVFTAYYAKNPWSCSY
jgi:hypothetical protein